MKRTIIALSLVSTAFALSAAPAATQESGDVRNDRMILERGRLLTGWLFDSRADSISERMAERYRSALGGAEGVARSVRSISGQLGQEEDVEQEAAFTRTSDDHYYRIARYAGAPATTITVHWAWNEAGEITYLRVQPTPEPAVTGHEDYRTKAELTLPFEGAWYVFWGGREPHLNHHVRAPAQRFAYDFLVLENGRSHTGTGGSNEDYHCFGRPILAPAAGRVTDVVDTVPDNSPGEMNEEAPAGNHVVLDHGGGEHSVLAHLRRNSVIVEEGDRVEAGRRLGACGNSGRSSEPHLHYHLQTEPEFGEGVGLPASFHDYIADGELMERGEPMRDQVIRPAPEDGG
ncbi:MAG: M23 family metallopeptidase [Gemmatimonadota bacterium]|nr:M23 family metallopeptidase [Gemmatimonadota bacterium]